MTDNMPDLEADNLYRNDILTEAARQHANLTQGADPVSVGEQMADRPLNTKSDTTWGDLSDELFEHAAMDILKAVDGAADLSLWAVSLGAFGLEAEEDAVIFGGSANKPSCAILFAFSGDVPKEDRRELMRYIDSGIQIRMAFATGQLGEELGQDAMNLAEKVRTQMGQAEEGRS